MAWKEIPDFNDEKAVVKKTIHETSGTPVIEVQYEETGLWQALEIEGMYQMIYWKKPDGSEEYGTGRYLNALTGIEETITAKEDICRRAEESILDVKNGSSRLSDLFTEWKALTNWHTPKETELWDRFNNARDSHRNAVDASYENNKTIKEQLIQLQKQYNEGEYKTPDEWKQAEEKTEALFVQWKNTGNCRKEDNQTLWETFNAERQTFFNNRSTFYKERNKERKENNLKKQKLIEEMQLLSTDVNNWSSAAQKAQTLFDTWKTIPTAGREEDEKLWKQFNTLRKTFFEEKKAHDSLYDEAAEQKQKLIEEAETVLHYGDYSRSSTDHMKQLQKQWLELGYAGKRNEELWTRFKTALDTFFEEKNTTAREKHEAWVRSMTDSILWCENKITSLEEQNTNLRERQNTTRNTEKAEQISGWITENEERIKELQEEIERKKKELE